MSIERSQTPRAANLVGFVLTQVPQCLAANDEDADAPRHQEAREDAEEGNEEADRVADVLGHSCSPRMSQCCVQSVPVRPRPQAHCLPAPAATLPSLTDPSNDC